MIQPVIERSHCCIMAVIMLSVLVMAAVAFIRLCHIGLRTQNATSQYYLYAVAMVIVKYLKQHDLDNIQ